MACLVFIMNTFFGLLELSLQHAMTRGVLTEFSSELELLRGINFKEVNINYFCIESYNIDKLKQFMNERNYKFITKLHREDYVFKRIN